jgi:arabinan endo-1,5-alpha-L-arabinosidase
MKKQSLNITIIGLLVLYICNSCTSLKEEVLIWNDPPTAADTLYQNPLFEPDLADPTVIRANDGWFYAYGTENEWASGIERLTPIVHSKDLVHWEYVADAFATKPAWKPTGYIWAPCIRFISGTYYLYYAISGWGDSNPGIGVATSQYPYGPFADQGKVFDAASIGVPNCIDPMYIEDGLGRLKKRYLFFGSYAGIYGIELSSDMKTTIGTKFKIAGNGFEAAYIYPKDGKYIFFGSNGNCCDGKDTKYHVTIAMATTIKGPYYTKTARDIIEDGMEASPFLTGDFTKGWVGPGHNGEIITDDTGHDYMLYHAVSYTNPLLPNGATRRPLMMDEVIWDSNGWPTIASGVPSNTLKRAPRFNN